MASDSQDHVQQLMLLRTLTQSGGVIHSAQLAQLKFWGGIAFFNDADAWEAKIDQDEFKVTYELTSKKKKTTKKLPSLIAALDRSVRWLLGDTWVLEVVRNGNPLYMGDRLSTPAQDKNEQRKQRVKSTERPKT